MTRAYIRLDPAFDERKEGYPDGPYSALIATFCLAEGQPDRGRFRSLDYLKRLLGKRGRHVQYLVDQKDISVADDGRVYVEGWDEWQEGDWKVNERVARIRSRRGNGDGNGLGNGDVTADRHDMAELSGAELSGALTGRRGPDAFDVYQRVTGSWPSPKVTPWLSQLVDDYDEADVCDALVLVTGQDPTRATLMSRVRDHLASEAHRKNREAEERREREEAAYQARERERTKDMTPVKLPPFGDVVKGFPS